MKTLNEVIKAFEICDETVTANCPDCPYDIDCENVPGEDLRTDALHYLKHLQEFYEMSREHHEPNPALTWDELKQMEGKPVWMEDDTGTKFYRGWAIVLNFIFDGTYLRYVCDDYSETCVVEEDIGKTWIAYRKERS